MIWQKEITLNSQKRGFHLITDQIIRYLDELPSMGILHIFIKHSSAALTINENADSSVRIDFENFINKLIPERDPVYTHIYEGDDDMPAHIKTSIFDTQLSIPITNGRLNLGQWQGIYLCEFRNQGGNRKIVLTIQS